MPEEDRELKAIHVVIGALEPLDDKERSRVLEYVLKRLDMAAVHAPVARREPVEPQPTAKSTRGIADIRTLKEEKQPRSATEMAALVAYYLSELAPDEARSDTLNARTIGKYFKMAGFRLPMLQYVLPNAAAAGYLNNVTRGEYRLNPVGYNLVVHGLPRAAASSGSKRSTRKKTTRKKTRKKKKTRQKTSKTSKR